VDKKQLLIDSLAKIMIGQISELNEIVKRYPQASITIKSDGSPVTELDLALSEHIESLMDIHFPNVTFYSEENFSAWEFPLLALDPLDGTREYIEGRDEWAISIGLFLDKAFKGSGWIYNPKTGECFASPSELKFEKKSFYRGEVSRSEFKADLFKGQDKTTFHIEPVGSIAYKLGRLTSGKCDFVVSLRPKNIWDIAGGTLLAKKAGFKFYSQGKEVTNVEKIYHPPLIWCHEELFSELSKVYP
jgi:fructose-1,6-bisphosphatase/inositol monophosphatase family enzyme